MNDDDDDSTGPVGQATVRVVNASATVVSAPLSVQATVLDVHQVTRGERVASFFWIQSLIRDEGDRIDEGLDEALAEARTLGAPAPSRYRRDPIGWLLWRTMPPPVRFRMPTIPAMVPHADRPPAVDLLPADAVGWLVNNHNAREQGWVFVGVYSLWGPTGAVLLAAPMLGVRQLYKTNWQLQRVNQDLLQLMVAAIEARDPYTSGHSRRVSRYARVIAQAIGQAGQVRVRLAAR